jgi:hypothetical protein
MNPTEVLTKAIRKAIEGGWTDWRLSGGDYIPWEVADDGDTVIIGDRKSVYKNYEHRNAVIFNQDFARALWGEPTLIDYDHGPQDGWQHHLQEMVIASDPIKYLGENI